MIAPKTIADIQNLVNEAHHILVLQADNPDGDSLGSALALEELLGNVGKKVSLYCGTDMPSYLRYIPGWDRVSKELPNTFDLSIIVDASTKTLFESIEKKNQFGRLSSKPCIVIDHHTSVLNGIDFATTMIVDASFASTGDIIFHIAQTTGWEISTPAAEFIMVSILGDTQGLSNSLASSATYRTMAELIDLGVNRPALEEKRREASKMTKDILLYKAELIQRADFSSDHRIASVTITPEEIRTHSPIYNPAPLIQTDLLQTEGVQAAIVFKYYSDGRVTGSIRCNPPATIADKLAEKFGGGGHQYASGFRVDSGVSVSEIKKQCIEAAEELLDNLEIED